MKKISIVAIAAIMVMGSMFTSCEAVKNTNNKPNNQNMR